MDGVTDGARANLHPGSMLSFPHAHEILGPKKKVSYKIFFLRPQKCHGVIRITSQITFPNFASYKLIDDYPQITISLPSTHAQEHSKITFLMYKAPKEKLQ